MRNFYKATALTIVALNIALLAGCANTLQSRNEEDYQSTAQAIQKRIDASHNAVLEAEARRIKSQEVGRPYVAGKSIPLSREARMPEPLRSSVPVTAHFANTPIPLATALQQLAMATGMSITATSDAMLPANMFAPKTANAAAAAVQAPWTVSVRSSGVPLWKVLDDIASQIQASWRPTPFGAEFYRVETKSYDLLTIPQTAETKASLGRTGSATNAFNSEAKTSFEMKPSNQMDGIKTLVETLLSTGGKFSISQESQVMVVTDTPEAQARVSDFVKRQNKVMTRRVRMLVEAIEVVAKDGSELGIDWNLVYNTTNVALTGAAPASLTTPQAGTINLQQMIGPLSGSSLVIKALNEVGTVVNRRVFPFITTSGRPITQALRSTFNYVDQVQTTAVANSSNSVVQPPTVIQRDETVGTFLTLVPNAKADGTVFISVSYDVTSAEPLRPYTVGSGASAVTVQQKTINGSGVIQEVPVRDGRTEVIGGIEILASQNTNRRLGDGIPILAGGSNASSKTKSVTVLLVTAAVEEGI